MKSGTGQHFKQAYNCQAAVDAEGSYLILETYVTDHANDKRELQDNVKNMPKDIRTVSNVLADTGYFNEKAITEVESDNRTTVYIPPGKQKHHKSISDLEKKDEPETPGDDTSFKEKMSHRLKTKQGKKLYKLRKHTVEPVFGIIKEVLGFRQFNLRGLNNVQTEWKLVTLAYNFKRLFTMSCQNA